MTVIVDLKQASIIIITIITVTLTKTTLAGVLVSYVPIPPCIHLLPSADCGDFALSAECFLSGSRWSRSLAACPSPRFTHIHLPGTVELLPW